MKLIAYVDKTIIDILWDFRYLEDNNVITDIDLSFNMLQVVGAEAIAEVCEEYGYCIYMLLWVSGSLIA